MRRIRGQLYIVNGFKGTLHDISQKFNILYKTLVKRMDMGFSLEEAVNRPLKKRNKKIDR